jgi:hypothetical protein
MAKQVAESNEKGTQPPQGATQKIAQDQWIPFLAEFTRLNRGAHARLEVLGTESDHYVLEDVPFEGIASDIKDGEHAVWIDLGDTPENHLTHGVQNVTAILARFSAPPSGPALEIISKDGTRTLLQLTLPEEYALPPAEG